MSLSYQIELHLPSGLLMWCTERMPGNSLNRRMLLPSRLSRVWRCLTWNFVIVLFPTLGSASRSLLKGLILLLWIYLWPTHLLLNVYICLLELLFSIYLHTFCDSFRGVQELVLPIDETRHNGLEHTAHSVLSPLGMSCDMVDALSVHIEHPPWLCSVCSHKPVDSSEGIWILKLCRLMAASVFED